MINRKVLGYFSMIFVTALCYELLRREQYIIGGIIGFVYVALIFGIDKIKFDLKNKKVEIQDDNRDS